MFPGPNATVYYNEAGEPLGWSDESYYEPDPDEFEEQYARRDAQHEEEYELGYESAQNDEELDDKASKWFKIGFNDGLSDLND